MGLLVESTETRILNKAKTFDDSELESPLVSLQVCSHIFLSSKILRTHMESHATEPKYECTECGKKFKSRAMWQHHGRLHTKVRCDVCLDLTTSPPFGLFSVHMSYVA